MKDRTKLRPEEFNKLNGSIESHQYRFDPKRNLYVKQINKIRGVATARRKARRFILATIVGNVGEMYLTPDGKLTRNKKESKFFFYGFDDPSSRARHWGSITGLKLFEHSY